MKELLVGPLLHVLVHIVVDSFEQVAYQLLGSSQVSVKLYSLKIDDHELLVAINK